MKLIAQFAVIASCVVMVIALPLVAQQAPGLPEGWRYSGGGYMTGPTGQLRLAPPRLSPATSGSPTVFAGPMLIIPLFTPPLLWLPLEIPTGPIPIVPTITLKNNRFTYDPPLDFGYPPWFFNGPGILTTLPEK